MSWPAAVAFTAGCAVPVGVAWALAWASVRLAQHGQRPSKATAEEVRR